MTSTTVIDDSSETYDVKEVMAVATINEALNASVTVHLRPNVRNT